jgi:hypothetical protein
LKRRQLLKKYAKEVGSLYSADGETESGGGARDAI